jgi:hypothetical protein
MRRRAVDPRPACPVLPDRRRPLLARPDLNSPAAQLAERPEFLPQRPTPGVCVWALLAAEAAALTIEPAKSLQIPGGLMSLQSVAADGTPVYAGPLAVRLPVRICANGVPAETLRSLVEEGLRCSPIPNAVQNAVPLELSIEVETDKE